MDFPLAPDYVGTAKSTERGKELWGGGEMGMACHKWHGDTGKGDGTSAQALKDSWGDRILPFDFTSGAMKGGSTVEDIYRTFVTGLDGTPMPSYEESLSEQERWDLVSYCVKLTEGE